MMKKIILGVTIILLTVFAVLEITIIRKAFLEKPEKSDGMVVLGCRLWGDQPSPMLTYRLEKALQLYKEGYASKIIVSGGQGDDELVSEAEAMKVYLVERGIREEDIYKEENSYSTYQNLNYSKQIMEREGFEKVVIVTNGFHIHRSLMIANRLRMEATGAPAKTYPMLLLRIKYYAREVPAYIKDYILVRIKSL